MRDYQRSKVYRAERTAHKYLKIGRRLSGIKEARTYVAAILRTRWWNNRSRVHEVRVIATHSSYGDAKAWDENINYRRVGFIVLPRWAYMEITVLHELAHLMPGGDDHGPGFVWNMCELVARFVGRKEAKMLRLAFEAAGVEWR